MTRLTNQEFAQRTDCDFTTASKLRNGKRRPGIELFIRMIMEFDLDPKEAVLAFARGRASFRDYINRTIFEPPNDEPAKETPKAPSTDVRFSN
jgi:transcriptional regulator with XRE-family HTH domain